MYMYVDFSDLYVDLSENYIDLSDIRLISRWQLGALKRYKKRYEASSCNDYFSDK